MSLEVSQINLKKYLPFFQHSIEYRCALGFFNNSGQLLQLADHGENEEFQLPVKQIESLDFQDSDSLTEAGTMSLGKEGAMIRIAVMLPHNQEPFWLGGLFKTPANEITEAQRVKAGHSLAHLSKCIVDDYTLQVTLTGMAEELTVRYEELNLLYGLDDADSHQISMDEKQAISQLINNCIDYMNVDLAVFYAPNLDLLIHKTNMNQPDLDIHSTLELIKDSLYRYISSTEKTLVINQNRGIDWTDANLETFHKILAAPAMLTKNYMAGILVLVNSANKPDFTNSDRKLCDVLASEAVKLIQARRDSITGLINRRGFTEILQQAQTKIKADPIKFSLLYIDIDKFKIINDTSGQKAGDRLLNHISGLITSTLKAHYKVGRLGADEFGVLLDHHDAEKAGQMAELICHAVNQFRFAYKDKLYDVSVCIGVAELNSEFSDFSATLSSAALACNVAKEQGSGRVHVYHSSDKEMIQHENAMHWVSGITQALEQDRFLIFRQKILPLQNKENTEEHYEILLRLKDEKGNLIAPFNFIPAAERYNLMSKLDRWVIKTTLNKMAELVQQDPLSPISCSINLSGQSFCEPRFAEFIIEEFNRTRVSTARVCFEITETAAVSNLSLAVKFIEKLKGIGCTFSLDDFGSGMSSFTYLKTLPVDYLKIDGYFVKTMMINPIDHAMVKSIHEIGKVMGLKTIAEFVENDEILNELAILGVDYGQGYQIAKPEPFE